MQVKGVFVEKVRECISKAVGNCADESAGDHRFTVDFSKQSLPFCYENVLVLFLVLVQTVEDRSLCNTYPEWCILFFGFESDECSQCAVLYFSFAEAVSREVQILFPTSCYCL